MNEYQSPSQRSWTPQIGQEQFPGIEGTLAGPPAVINPTVISPPKTVAAPKSGLPFNITNLTDLKAMVDRMGGLEGVLATMGKLQKFMVTVQQIAPMIKLFMGKKGNKTATTNKGRRKRTSTRKRITGNSGVSKNRNRRPSKRR